MFVARSDTVFVYKEFTAESSFQAVLRPVLPHVDRVVVKNIDFFGSGTDNVFYICKSNLVAGRVLSYFKETRGVQAPAVDYIHNIDNFSPGSLYNFIMTEGDGTDKALTGEMMIVLEFQMMSK